MSVKSTSVIRFDQNRAGKAERTPEGFLRVPATISRAGVLVYNFADGSQRRELVLPEELGRADSIASLSMLPVTNDHPAEGMVTPENAKRLQVGQLSETAKADSGFLRTKMLVTDGAAIGDIANGKTQVSAGYRCDLEMTAGVYEGERFDAIQRNRIYNHVAIVAAGRAGPEVALHLDSKDPTLGVSVTEDQKTMEKINIDGVDIELEATKAAIVKAALGKRDGEIKAANEATQKATAKADALTVERDNAEKARKDAADPTAIAKLVQARVALQSQATKYLGADFKVDSASDRDLMLAVSGKFAPSKVEELKKADEAYVRAFYDASLEGLAKQATAEAEQKVDEVRTEPKPETKNDKAPDSHAARQAMIKRNAERLKPKA